ncbi:hypothetical protein EV368DRAFT_88704 [Lentinula lateritia]|nr:hypothetical protein EV368DRAFT_88704 [Lentinula lateritia]
MSARLHTPGAFTSPLFEFRQRPGQIYDELTQSFKDMGPTAIANAEYGIDFFREKYGDEWSTHFCYVDSESQEFSGNLFGEILGKIHGTAVGATGNHFAGIDRSLFTSVKEIVKELVSNRPLDAITLTGPLLYAVPQGERKLGSKKNTEIDYVASKLKKRKLNKLSDAEEELAVGSHHANDVDLGFPPDASITVGAQYDYKLMPDYGGKVFAFNKARLIQPDWRKLDGDLIVPWKNYLQLRPGTVVVANVSFRLHVLQPKDKRQCKRKVYQAVINYLKVVAESNISVLSPVPPFANGIHTNRDIPPADGSAISVLRSIGTTRVPSRMGNVFAAGQCSSSLKETPVSAKRMRRSPTYTSRPSADTYVGQANRVEDSEDMFTLGDMDLNGVEYNAHMAIEEDDVD